MDPNGSGEPPGKRARLASDFGDVVPPVPAPGAGASSYAMSNYGAPNLGGLGAPNVSAAGA